MKKKTIKTLTIIAIIIVLLSLSYAIAVSYSSAKLSQAYSGIEKDRRPMVPADVIPPKVADSQNAALLYECAASFLKAQPSPNGNLLMYLGAHSDKFIKETLDSDKLTEFEQLMAQEKVLQALSMVEQGTQRDACRYDLNYDDGLGIRLPHLHGLRNLIFIGCAKAQIEAKTGNPDNAWDMIATQLKFTDALWTEPILISQLVRIASIRLSCKTITKVCEIAPPNEQQYNEIQNLLKDLDDIRPLIHAIDAERILFGEWAFNIPKDELNETMGDFSENYNSGLISKLVFFGMTFKPISLADHAAYMRFMHEGVRFAERPYSREQADVLEKGIQKKRYILTRILTPAIFRVKEVHCRMIADVRITRAGLALLQDKQTQDTFPDTLEEIDLQNINDPFSDGPLLYKTEGQGFVLYSVGPDQKDNNGSPRQKKQETDWQETDWDVVWIFPGRQ